MGRGRKGERMGGDRKGEVGGRRRRGEGDEREITLFMCVTYTGLLLLLFFSKKFL